MDEMTRAEVRPAAVAGLFYPADAEELSAMVDMELQASAIRPEDPPPKALIAPHAGYVYSGPVAASAYATLGAAASAIRRVVLLGPAHRVSLEGMAVPTVGAFETPLGEVPLDEELMHVALASRSVVADDRPHDDEHGLEVHLPFLQRLLGPTGWTVLPVVVGRTDADVVADLLLSVWGGPETLVVVSTDLSHYHSHDSARQLDAATAGAILARRAAAIRPSDACGVYPLRGLLVVAERLGMDLTLLDLRTSADTAGEPSRVVGYGAFSVTF
jgi:AmmeMemoRadiSam system protein B